MNPQLICAPKLAWLSLVHGEPSLDLLLAANVNVLLINPMTMINSDRVACRILTHTKHSSI